MPQGAIIKILKTPLARGLAITSVVVGVGTAVWRYSDVPPGAMIKSYARTDTVKEGGCAFLLLLPGECDPVVDTGAYTMQFDVSLRTCPLIPVERWPTETPMFVKHWGVFLCNDAQAPAAFLEEMKPYLKDAALRDFWSFAGRLISIPLAGLLGAIAFVGASIVIVRVGRWIKSGL